MTTMFVRHTVADYATWRAVYDAFDVTNRGLGVTGQAVWQSASDPNDLTVSHEFASLEEAQAFASNPQLKQAMGDAGVVGAPTIWFASRV